MRSSWYRRRACTVVTAVSAAVKLATSNQETRRWFGVMSAWCAGRRPQVDRVPRWFAQQDPPHLLGRLGPQLDEPLDAVERRVRGEEDAGMVPQPGVVERLALDHVEARGGEVPRVERGRARPTRRYTAHARC